MRDLGYREGFDFVLELRTGDGRNERLPALAAELARLNVTVIVTSSTPATKAAMQATRTIPIVFANSADPVATGLVKSLARPGGNVTGLSNVLADLGQKQLQLLRAALPNLAKLGVLMNPGNETNFLIARDVQDAARKSNISVIAIEAKDRMGIEAAFRTLTRENAPALIVALEPFFVQERHEIAEMALRHRIATMFGGSDHVQAGGLLSYGPDIADNFRRAAAYVDRILKGAKPGDLPIEQPAKLDLLINLKTARTLGIAIPEGLRIQAERLFE